SLHDALPICGRLRIVRYDKPFNHSAMSKEVGAACESELVVFLNNYVVIRSDGWLEQLIATAELDPTIAAAGGLLLYPDGTMQHAGVILGLYPGLAGHAFRGLPTDG